MPKRKVDTPEPPEKIRPKFLREKLLLAEQAASGGLKVLPGEAWKICYARDGAARQEKLQGLVEGKYQPEEVYADLKPDAIMYDMRELEQPDGMKNVIARIRDVSSRVAHYDHKRFSEFIVSMKDRGLDVTEIQTIYEQIADSHTRHISMESMGSTGQQQIQTAIQQEVQRSVEQMEGTSRIRKILETLKINWAHEDIGCVDSSQRDKSTAQLSKEEFEIYESLKDAYREYVTTGSPSAYSQLVEAVRTHIPPKPVEQIQEEEEEERQEFEEALEQFKDQVGPPGGGGDPGIHPDDQDEYITPKDFPSESKEKAEPEILFEIIPSGTSKYPLTGNYACGRKSYYDIDKKTWSKKKQLQPYREAVSGDERQTMSAKISNSGLKALPCPVDHAFDISSLKHKGAKPEILRDQNGCFYIQISRPCEFSIDLVKVSQPFVSQPIAEDAMPLYKGSLSTQTEAAIRSLSGTNKEKAEQARRYITSHHFYPGNGDLKSAQALQLKLREESTGDNYIQNLDASKYLECYSANTLLIAMLRQSGVPARLVTGHNITGSDGNKACITSATGHAWAEVWDGNDWHKIDATPPPEKQQTGDKQQHGEGQEQGESQPQQGEGEPQQGEGQPQEGDAPTPQEVQQKVDQTVNDVQNQEMPEATQGEAQQAQSDLEEARKQMEQMQQKMQEMQKKIQDAQSFKDLQKAQKEAESEDLLDDMREDIEERREAKEGQMKEEIKDKMDKMVEDGFLDEQRRDELEQQLEDKELNKLDRLKNQIDREGVLYDEYEEIKREVEPLVDKWYKYFAERLPRKDEVSVDEDSLTRQGAFNRHSVMKPRNLLFGTVKNPRMIKPSFEPRFIATLLIDVSGSMGGEKLTMVRKWLIFKSELFSRISKEFGYIMFSIMIFSDGIKIIKDHDQDYDASERYDFADGTPDSTIKLRLMQQVQTSGGTNMLPAIQKAAHDLQEMTFEYPNYMSALYFSGDGGDTCGNADKVRQFLTINNAGHGFGEHMYSAIMLGGKSQKAELANIFGEDHTTVAPDFDALIEESMIKFDEDISFYLEGKTV